MRAHEKPTIRARRNRDSGLGRAGPSRAEASPGGGDVWVKVCCIRSAAEARLAARMGADAIGLVSAMPSGPGVIEDRLIAEIAAAVASSVETFLLTSKCDPEDIAAQHDRARTRAVQLCDRMRPAHLEWLRRRLAGVRLVQVIHVEEEGALADALTVAPFVDGLLLDSGRPSAPVRQLGGTGRTHDWAVSRRIAESVEAPVYLAGGLRAENVQAAIARVRPSGVDLCSGVRDEEGTLDESRLAAFMAAARARREER